MVFKNVFNWFKKDDTPAPQKTAAAAPTRAHKTIDIDGATAIKRADHPISRKDFSPNALKVLYRLKDQGYDAYLVGGCIRDVLLGLHPKDFDVVTNATPEQVKSCFNNCRIIGRRFKLAHVLFGREIIEVATFRGPHEEKPVEGKHATSRQSQEGQLLRDNVYGTIQQDAVRRDFTINALYYCIKTFTIYDFANGMDAINKGEIDLIGDPETRYREDPVRMLRAIRFANKLRMTIAPRTEEPIFELGHLLRNIPPARLFDESLKLFLSGKAEQNFQSLQEYGLFRYYFPVVAQGLNDDNESKELRLLELMFAQSDARINDGKSVSPAFILAALFWYPIETHANELEHESGLHPYDAFQMAVNDILHRAIQTVAIPKRISAVMREIWSYQHRLTKVHGKRPAQLVEQPRFRAAYDFLLLRAEVEGGELTNLATWWTDYQKNNGHSDTKPSPKGKSGRYKNRRPRRRNSSQKKGPQS